MGSLFYVWSIMKKYNSEQILSIVISAAAAYSEKLLNKHFLIIFQDRNSNNSYRYKEIGFRDYNFLHLTGLKTSMSASAFFSAATSDRLSVKQFTTDNKGKCIQKLNALPYLSELLYNHCLIGDFINSGISIRADYFTGDTKAVLSLGFRNGDTVDNPVSLYNEDIRKLTAPTNRVVAIYSKPFDAEKYETITYSHSLYNENLFKESFPEFFSSNTSAEGTEKPAEEPD